MNANQMIRAGNDMSLDSREGTIARIVNSPGGQHPTQLTALHNAAKHILYTQANSAAMAFVGRRLRDLCPERPRRHRGQRPARRGGGPHGLRRQ